MGIVLLDLVNQRIVDVDSVAEPIDGRPHMLAQILIQLFIAVEWDAAFLTHACNQCGDHHLQVDILCLCFRGETAAQQVNRDVGNLRFGNVNGARLLEARGNSRCNREFRGFDQIAELLVYHFHCFSELNPFHSDRQMKHHVAERIIREKLVQLCFCLFDKSLQAFQRDEAKHFKIGNIGEIQFIGIHQETVQNQIPQSRFISRQKNAFSFCRLDISARRIQQLLKRLYIGVDGRLADVQVVCQLLYGDIVVMRQQCIGDRSNAFLLRENIAIGFFFVGTRLKACLLCRCEVQENALARLSAKGRKCLLF